MTVLPRGGMSDASILVRATLRIYAAALKEAAAGWIKNWRLIFVHCLIVLAFGMASPLALLFGGLAGGFILGALLALAVSAYLAGVAAGVRGERQWLREIWPDTVELFWPTIHVLFVFFIAELLIGLVLQQGMLRLYAGLFLCILFNVLPELIYQRPSGGLQQFADSLEFIRDNCVEWFLPAVVAGLPLWLMNRGMLLPILLISTSNPLRLLEAVFMTGMPFGAWLGAAPLLAAGLGLVYYVFLFRGVLFRELAGSTRRKRVYQERAR